MEVVSDDDEGEKGVEEVVESNVGEGVMEGMERLGEGIEGVMEWGGDVGGVSEEVG